MAGALVHKPAAALALVLATTVLAACGDSGGRQDRKPAATPTPFVKDGWASVWGDARNTVELLNNMGFRLSPYAQQGAAYRATALPTPMADPSTKPVNIANLTITGDAATIRSLRYTVDLVNLKTSAFAKEQFSRWVTRPMVSMALDGVAPIDRAIRDESDARGTVKGADYSVTRETIDGGRRLVVTFTRPAAMPGTSEPRKQ